MSMGGVIPDSLYKLSNLRVLMLHANTPPGFEGSLKANIGNLAKLRILDISDHSLTGILPTELGNCEELGELVSLCIV